MNYKNCCLDMKNLFFELRDKRYFATKINTPFFKFDKEFPEMYPVGRDVDLIVHPEDFESICEIVQSYCQQQGMNYRVLHDSSTHQRHRLESSEYFLLPNAVATDKRRNGLPLTKLHFQFDISSVLEEEYQGIDVSPLIENMSMPVIRNGVKTLSNKNEALLRCVFYAKSKSLHHRSFIYLNRDLIETRLINDSKIWDAINPVIS